MIKAVLDTNIFISSVFWKGVPYEIVESGLESRFLIFTSKEIIEEVRNKLLNKFNFPENDTNDLLEEIVFNSEVIVPGVKIDVVKRDPSDNKIIECAVAGEADYIVTGDRHLLEIKEYKGVKIITPRQFLNIIK